MNSNNEFTAEHQTLPGTDRRGVASMAEMLWGLWLTDWLKRACEGMSSCAVNIVVRSTTHIAVTKWGKDGANLWHRERWKSACVGELSRHAGSRLADVTASDQRSHEEWWHRCHTSALQELASPTPTDRHHNRPNAHTTDGNRITITWVWDSD